MEMLHNLSFWKVYGKRKKMKGLKVHAVGYALK